MSATGSSMATRGGGGAGGGGRGDGGGGASAGQKGRPRYKRRSWLFKVDRVTNTGIAEADIFAVIRCKYSMLRRLAVRPAASRTARGSAASAERGAADVLVEVHFAGPQPSVGCGALLRSLLGGESVEAWPIELPRGRKRKDGVAEEDSGNAGPEAAEGVRTSAQQPPEGFCEDARLRSQRHQHEQQEEQQQQQNHHHRHQFATQNTVPIPPTPLLAVQPQQLDARPLIFGDGVTSAGGYGDTNTTVPLDAGNSFYPPRIGASRTGFGGERGALLSMEDVRVEPSRKECDFEGRPFTWSSATSAGAPIAAGTRNHGECYLVFTGLDRTGHNLGSLNVTALFGMDKIHRIATVTSPLQVGADGRVYAELFYPSLQDIWPDLYSSPNIHVAQVEVEVEVLPHGGGEYRFRGPLLKLAYFRADPNTNHEALLVAPGPSA